MSKELQKCCICKCDKLLSFFSVIKTTEKHFKTCNSCREKYKCSKCDYKCSQNSVLRKHIDAAL